ncbi:molybdopterin-containing oxidoreductase family protein [Rhizorhabdus dicambivorans]|uniref:4Fe-4S Mo/W bis-MGD-type domain-containing protein n=1 Tax=Rhizorhabdus dicambivorans TaxID=1850238 RepID=A0A2A4FSI0_9SPHN|nr:molybdopterin-dependent oxidoreductase [Rhizorhabdus dicambivorans]ATE63836.1 hypothetical protein CMV14_05040 [Rhizorhabdus dicambivorans]PCE40670.1 hypothetical protein COO09_18940 [Rhizorhabdus dicambivorans]
MHHEKHSFCRICEPFCPVVASVDGAGKVVSLRPDESHPSGGTACHKGLSFLDVHNDPDRLDHPLRRTNGREQPRGLFVETDWNPALADIGARLAAIRDAHGPNAIAGYLGNPIAFDAPAYAAYLPFMEAVGSRMRFGANTQDMVNKLTGAGHIYGSTRSALIPDLHNSDYLLCMGANPKVSRWTMASIPNDGLDILRKLRARGGTVRFINPRRTESSTEEIGPTHFIRPGTDVYFLAALLNAIIARGGVDRERVARFGKNADALFDFAARYPADRVAAVTGIPVAEVWLIAREICEAPSAAVYMSTGVSQSRQGMLAYWLSEMINFVTGNLGRKGGTIKPNGLIDAFPPMVGSQQVSTSVGDFTLPDPIGPGLLPTTMLPDLIEAGDVRALILWSGNPLISTGGEERMRKAFEKLDLLISIDIFRSATAELADYVLPATSWLERKDINLVGMGMQAIPYVQYTEAIEAPGGNRRDAPWILARIAQEMGIASVFDENPGIEDVSGAIIDQLLANRGLTRAQLASMPSQTLLLDPLDPESFYTRCLRHPDGRIDCCPPAFAEAGLFERCDRIFDELAGEPDDMLKLVNIRTPYHHNGWMPNVARFRRGRNAENPLRIGPADADRLDLFDGDQVRIVTQEGGVDAEVLVDASMGPGTAAMTHGFGNHRTYGMRVAQRRPGVNVNAVMPMGPEAFEPLSNMSWISAVPIRIEKIDRPE